MSLDMYVYTGPLSDELIPALVKRLNEFDMKVEIHPEFSFESDDGSHDGYLPFKFRLKNPYHKILEGKTLTSGFEVYVSDFNLPKEKVLLNPPQGFFARLFGKTPPEVPFASPEVESRLKDCSKCVDLVWHAGDSFQLRFVSLASAILAELTNGVCCYPADDIWYDTATVVEELYRDVLEYENSLPEKELQFHLFEGW